ncbi:MAG: chaperone NapD [Thermodesulfovibrionia bacterium]|nr:chaperone NapD [Thermodesulfovibrionia bacterium]
MNVSSIIVKTTPEHLQEVMDNINAVDFCDVHFHDPGGKIVATIEGKNIDEQMERMKKIQGIPNVFSANLSFSYCEDELIEALGQIEGTGDPVPGKLK